MLINVLVHSRPPVGLQESFFGLVHTVVTRKWRSVGVFDGWLPHGGRQHQQNPTRLVWSFEMSPEDVVLNEAVRGDGLHGLCFVRIWMRGPVEQEGLEGHVVGLLFPFVADGQLVQGNGLDEVARKIVSRHLASFLVDDLKIELSHGKLQSILCLPVHLP